MYNIIKTIIDHVWESNGQVLSSTEQQLVYYIAGALIILFTVWILDRISVFIINTAKGGKG